MWKRAALEELGDDMPLYVLEGENRSSRLIVTFTRCAGQQQLGSWEHGAAVGAQHW
jgi:hypothetical protein